jgi:hypothetical protein
MIFLISKQKKTDAKKSNQNFISGNSVLGTKMPSVRVTHQIQPVLLHGRASVVGRQLEQ